MDFFGPDEELHSISDNEFSLLEHPYGSVSTAEHIQQLSAYTHEQSHSIPMSSQSPYHPPLQQRQVTYPFHQPSTGMDSIQTDQYSRSSGPATWNQHPARAPAIAPPSFHPHFPQFEEGSSAHEITAAPRKPVYLPMSQMLTDHTQLRTIPPFPLRQPISQRPASRGQLPPMSPPVRRSSSATRSPAPPNDHILRVLQSQRPASRGQLPPMSPPVRRSSSGTRSPAPPIDHIMRPLQSQRPTSRGQLPPMSPPVRWTSSATRSPAPPIDRPMRPSQPQRPASRNQLPPMRLPSARRPSPSQRIQPPPTQSPTPDFDHPMPLSQFQSPPSRNQLPMRSSGRYSPPPPHPACSPAPGIHRPIRPLPASHGQLPVGPPSAQRSPPGQRPLPAAACSPAPGIHRPIHPLPSQKPPFRDQHPRMSPPLTRGSPFTQEFLPARPPAPQIDHPVHLPASSDQCSPMNPPSAQCPSSVQPIQSPPRRSPASQLDQSSPRLAGSGLVPQQMQSPPPSQPIPPQPLYCDPIAQQENKQLVAGPHSRSTPPLPPAAATAGLPTQSDVNLETFPDGGDGSVVRTFHLGSAGPTSTRRQRGPYSLSARPQRTPKMPSAPLETSNAPSESGIPSVPFQNSFRSESTTKAGGVIRTFKQLVGLFSSSDPILPISAPVKFSSSAFSASQSASGLHSPESMQTQRSISSGI